MDGRLHDRLTAVVAAFDVLTASQKAALIVTQPELYFAVAKLVRHCQADRGWAR